MYIISSNPSEMQQVHTCIIPGQVAPAAGQLLACCAVLRTAGTSLRYKPGLVTGGSGLVHDCGTSRSIGYYLEPLTCLALFGKKVRKCYVRAPPTICQTATLPPKALLVCKSWLGVNQAL